MPTLDKTTAIIQRLSADGQAMSGVPTPVCIRQRVSGFKKFALTLPERVGFVADSLYGNQ